MKNKYSKQSMTAIK